jgi:[ribosomal protein S18]-alanine N-acetyltransferase
VEFRLREYRPEDFQALWRIDQECFPPGIAYSQRELAAYIRRKGAFTIVAQPLEKQGEPAASIQGFIVGEVHRSMGHIISIDVLAPSRRSGLGSKLLMAAEQRLVALNCRSVVLETAVDNTGALSFYKRHNYSVLKTSPRYYSNGVDAFVLGKNLSPLQDWESWRQ